MRSSNGASSRPAGATHAIHILSLSTKKKLILGCALLLAALDQVTKLVARHALADLPEGQAVRVVRGILYLKPTVNTGGIWGLGGSLPPVIFAVISVLFNAYLTALVLRLTEREQGYLPVLALILGGFIGNGIDRIRLGSVTDFIYFTGYPAWLISTFNVADLAILLGIAWLVGRYLVASFRARREAPK